MFKEALSSLGSSVMGATRATLREYKPTTQNLHGSFERIAHQGIANLSYRSPILADVAQTVLQNFQIQSARKDQFKAYVNTKGAAGFRKEVSDTLGEGASSKKIDAEMVRILSKISNTIDSQGKDEAKKSAIFKEFGKHFTKFNKESEKKSAPASDPATNGDGSPTGDNSQILAKIENNTQRTFNAIEMMLQRGTNMGGAGGTNGKGQSSFIDPMTGMPSMTAAVGSIGGSFLGKVFDDATIEKFATKAKIAIGIEKAPEAPTAPTTAPKTKASPTAPPASMAAPVPVKKPTVSSRKRGGSVAGIENTLTGLTETVNTDKNAAHVISVNNNSEAAKEKLTKVSTETVSESAKEIEAATNKRADDLLDVNKKILAESKLANATTKKKAEKAKKNAEPADTKLDVAKKPKTLEELAKKIAKEKAGPLIDRAKDVAKEKAGKLLGKLGGKVSNVVGAGKNILAKVTPTVMRAGAVASAGGSLLGGAARAVGSSVIGAGARVAGGALLGAAMPALAAAAPLIAGAAAVGAVGYGAYKLYDHYANKKIKAAPKTNPLEIAKPVADPQADVQTIPKMGSSDIPTNISAAKTSSAMQITNLQKSKQSSEKVSNTNQAPIIINAGNGGATPSGGKPSPAIITSSPVRNQESTFERVQMQDFWPRMA